MKKIVLLLCFCFVFLSGCSSISNNNSLISATTSNEKVQISFTKDTFPRVDGSTVTIPLSEGMASRLLDMTSDEAKNFIKHNTTHPAYENLIAGNADIIFVTEPSDQELSLAKSKNIDLEVIPVVKDAFVFLADTENPVNSLTVKQIQNIYQGRIKNWSSVGGKYNTITAFQRPKNSGSQTLMENMVMKGLTLMDAPKEYVPDSMQDLIEMVAGYDNSERALGYSVYYYAKTMYISDDVKFLGVNNVKPENKTIANGSYPFSIAYYAVLKKSESENSPARMLLKWLLSEEGQLMAGKCGYVPLN